MFSVIDPEMIRNIEFYKGGFTSEYAGRVSSVMRLITKDGNKNKLSGKASLSTLTGKALIEGPIPDGSFILTGRRSYNTSVLKKFLNNNNIPIDFWDASFKLDYANDKVFEDGRLSLHGFISGDVLDNDSEFEADFKWKNKLLGFKWLQLSDSPLFFEIGFSFSEFEGEVNPNFSRSRYMRNVLRDYTLQMDFKYVYETKDELDIGLKIQEVENQLLLSSLNSDIKDIAGPKGTNISVYVKYKFLRYDDFGVDIGSRLNLTRISVGDAGTYWAEPRISMTYRIFPFLALKAAAGTYLQELTTLSDEDDLISIFEPWFVTPIYLDPARAIHLVTGLDAALSEHVSFELEGYYKKIIDFPSLNDRKFFPNDPDLVAGRTKPHGNV